ncbi:hypothetical protein MNEG_2822 [Monoraphidium neglectum]|uniref:Uncharacterized protein n=1 Tax=Monoraphidium neglectum TaxID=145388 RepID=A0A0D2LEP1_9CHLO|nr:hypothetical protein MNEG_2822 [Monoraphidium neglectum]KIZ05139.1 hypothetical protein MNEG_2822 [Monoraphidium neglectum]|eukprot:XP_013904158.1 hypothetical protein MNEG_2822 [Monoraphidium neglectum]
MSGEDDLARKLLPLGAFAGAAADADLRQPSGSSWASSFSTGTGAAPPAAALAGRSSDSLMGSSPPQALSLAALSSLLTRTTSGPAEEKLLMQLQQQLEAIAGSGGAAGAAAMFEGTAAASALPALGLRGPGLPAHLQPGGAAPLQVLLGGGRGDEGGGGSSGLQPLHAFLSAAGRVTAAASAATHAAARGGDEAASTPQRLERSGRSDASTSAAAAASITGGAPAAAAAARGEAQGESGGGAAPVGGAEDEAPPLVRELGVSLESMERLFTADTQQEFKQPVWMVVNLQSKIKGSYTADKMMEFCKRGTLSGRQLVLGIDRDLPYLLRQDLGFYTALGQLALDVHAGGRYIPLSAALARDPSSWVHVAPPSPAGADGSVGVGRAAGAPGGGARGGAGAGEDAALRGALERLFTPAEAAGARQPTWLYVNHLGGEKECGTQLRLPRPPTL